MQLFDFSSRLNPHQSPYSNTHNDTASPTCSSYIKTINAQEESKGYRYRLGCGIMRAKRIDKEPAPLTNPAGEVRELKPEDFAKFQPAHEVIPGIAEGIKRPIRLVSYLALGPVTPPRRGVAVYAKSHRRIFPVCSPPRH